MTESPQGKGIPMGDAHTPVNPYIMKSIEDLHNRLNMQRETSQQMWAKLKPSVDLAEWIQKTYPEIMEQYSAVKDLERLSGSRVGVGGFARPMVKREGGEVGYGDI